MKFDHLFLFFFLALFYCTSQYADENKYLFIGQNGNETAFTLEITGNIPEDHILISEDGEIHIKVDRVIAIPKEFDSNVSDFSLLYNAFLGPRSCVLGEDSVQYCGNRVSPRKWQCPYCHLWWDLGERCKNDDCPTNRWKKE